ncbi:small fragment nuclease [Clupea harengus]|uniref:Oligoribonuclease, mitochondrial n=1 Tax=Clupea harengus TaxID=7950 RepID=A0A6P3VE29_CLUHA|nr:small fragment nuclease [Clupea harengus]
MILKQMFRGVSACSTGLAILCRVVKPSSARRSICATSVNFHTDQYRLASSAFSTRLLSKPLATTIAVFKGNMDSCHLSDSASADSRQRIVWVDLEMTGLDIEKDEIIEMACIITDSELNILAEGPNLIINQPDELLDGMSEWCQTHHGSSGLTQAVRDSKISLQDAEKEFLSFIKKYTPPHQCPLAGNSVHADKKFLDKYMPQFMSQLHYRIIDVSTVKELCRRWYPAEYKKAPSKKGSHRALDDIRESISELKFYRKAIFKTPHH